MFQKKLNKEVLIYMDDIFIIKKTKEKHQEKTRRTLEKLLKIRLRIKFFKNKFKKEEIKFLRHIIKRKDIKLDSKKIRMLRK